MKTENELFETALHLAMRAHCGQIDKCKMPYILHPLFVAGCVDTLEQKIVALLHDVVEDSNITLKHIASYGFSKEIIEAVDLLTHRSGVNYKDYIKSIRENKLATKVKIADLTHNMQKERTRTVMISINSFNCSDKERSYKYAKFKEKQDLYLWAYEYLTGGEYAEFSQMFAGLTHSLRSEP